LEEKPEVLVRDEDRKILIFNRKKTIFALNFNPSVSFPDYGFAVQEGEYRSVMDTDEEEFDGFSRLQRDEVHATVGSVLYLYLPSRCALILEKVK
jgi:1,4-alpha-glucan branching enzyme